MNDRLMTGLCATAGAAVWLGISAWTGKREAWDSGMYYWLGMPVLMSACAAAGWLAPRRPWRWPAAAFAAQPLALLLKNGPGSMLPLGLLVFAVFSLPCLATAYAAAFLRKELGPVPGS